MPLSNCEMCKDMSVLLSLFGDECVRFDADVDNFDKEHLNTVLNYVNVWNQKHCLCIFKDTTNYVRFDNLVQSLVVTSFNLLNSMIAINDASSDVNSNDDYFSTWDNEDREKLLHLKSKAFSLQFPLYIAFKHSNLKNEELTAREARLFDSFCDLTECDANTFLMRKLAYFIDKDGLTLYTKVFQQAQMSIMFAHSMLSVVNNVRSFFSMSSIENKILTLRSSVINFLCNIKDSDLRVINNRAMFEYIWSVFKDTHSDPKHIDKDGLSIALKYFTSSTLTMRLSGLGQISNYITIYTNCLHNNHSAAARNVSLINDLVQWCLDNNLVEHIFGPNSHVEIVRQTSFLFIFLADRLTNSHIDIIWASAHLKHHEKYVFEILFQIVQKFHLKQTLYLYSLLYKLKPKEHTENTLNLAAQIIKCLWFVHGVQPDMIVANDNRPFFSSESIINRQFARMKSSPSSESSIEVNEDEDDDDDEEFDDSDMTNHVESLDPSSVHLVNAAIANPRLCRRLSRAVSEDSESLDGSNDGTASSNSGSEIDIDSTDHSLRSIDSGDDCSNLELKPNSEDYTMLAEQRMSEVSNKEIDCLQSQYFLMNSLEQGGDEKIDESRDCDNVPMDTDEHKVVSNGVDSAKSSSSEKTKNHMEVDNSVAFAKSEHVLPDDVEYVFECNDVCKPNNTLLWDVLQDDVYQQFTEEIAVAAEKAFWNLVCSSSNKAIRLQFIYGFLDNLANNQSVITSLRMLQKLFSSFYQYQDGRFTRKLIVDAEKSRHMLKHFFTNLTLYMSSFDKNAPASSSSDLPYLRSKFHTHSEEVQIRLNFFSFILVYGGSHDSLSFSQERINILWYIFTNTATTSPDICDEFFRWLLNQVKITNALSMDLIKYILFEKMPLLCPESCSITSMELLQHLHGYILTKSIDSMKRCPVLIRLLWNIAFKNCNDEVSQKAIHHLNSYYITVLNFSNKFDKEEDFIHQCINSLKEASLMLPLNCDQSLVLIQRAVILIKTHLETFNARYSYFYRKLSLLSDFDKKMHRLCNKQNAIKIVVTSPQGNRVQFDLLPTDHIGDLRAEVQFWYNSLNHHHAVNNHMEDEFQENLICLVLHDQHEVPFECDEKVLLDVGFKESEENRVTFRTCKQLSFLDPVIIDKLEPFLFSKSNQFFDSFKMKNPKKILLREHNFELLFTLMNQLDTIDMTNIKARIFSRNIWEIIQLLPTSKEVLNSFQLLLGEKNKTAQDDAESNSELLLKKLFPLNSYQKIIYSCQIVDYYNRQKNDRQRSQRFIRTGGLKYLYNLLIAEVESTTSPWTEWKQDCLAMLTQIVYQFGIYVLNGTLPVAKKVIEQPYLFMEPNRKNNKRARKDSDDEKVMILQMNAQLLALISDQEKLLQALLSILKHVSHNSKLVYQTAIWHRSQVVHFVMTFLISWSYSDSPAGTVLDIFYKQKDIGEIVKKLILNDTDAKVRKESLAAFVRLCLGDDTQEETNLLRYVPQFLKLLLNFLDEALAVNTVALSENSPQPVDEPPPILSRSVNIKNGSKNKDYFNLVSMLIEPFVNQKKLGVSADIDMDYLCTSIAKSILTRKCYETRKNTVEDEGLRGLLSLLTVLIKYNPSYKARDECREFISKVFAFLFALPSPTERELPKCKSNGTRIAAYDLLLEIVRSDEENYVILSKLLTDQHRHEVIGRSLAYPWEYWPQDDNRSECGFVGLTNLGATCYMASCMQHLFMLPEARNAVLQTNLSSVIKHDAILRELQKMFIYLQESERKAYNPKNFCKVYIMDNQPLNICEQKDMTEFFTDLISKLEEMTIDLKDVVKKHFSGQLSNNVVSLDCPHISQTKEEFYTLRCQVADLKDLYESLNELTVKDTLDGDNMYNCSKCGKKVRAEKRACLRKLPRILCFNTMRYTFNVMTMGREKINTHFSFPFTLDMEPYLEKNLINLTDDFHEDLNDSDQSGSSSPDDGASQPPTTSTKYELIGVTVHTGTADGGHYYSFIQDRDAQSKTVGQWFLFNDAEVKPFDKKQLPAECFGGYTISKSYDQLQERFRDVNVDKNNSAYMLFYERCDPVESPAEKDKSAQAMVTNQSGHQDNVICQDLLDWIWNENLSFLRDRSIFHVPYFDFIWHVCAHVPPTLKDSFSDASLLISTRLATLFLMETLIHSKEKTNIYHWIELLTKQLNNSPQACEWLMDHLSEDDWWTIQILFKCSNRMMRQLFYRLCLHVINNLKPTNRQQLENSDIYPTMPHCIQIFMQRLLSLISIDGALGSNKPNIKYLTEYFHFLTDFAKKGDDECNLLLSIEAISTMVAFYMSLGKLGIACCNELALENSSLVFSDVEDEDFDERPNVYGAPVEEKFPKFAALDKMITLITLLLERAHEMKLPISERDFDSIISGRNFTFIQQQIRDQINLRQTYNLISSICLYDDSLISPIINMIFNSITLGPDRDGFFKIMTFTMDPKGIPYSFSKIFISKIWEIAEHAPSLTLEWLVSQVPRNKTIHQHILSTLNDWVLLFLVENSNVRVRANAAQLLISLVPGEASFRTSYRAFRAFPYVVNRDINFTVEAQSIIDKLLAFLFGMIKRLKNYADIHSHGTQKLSNFFYVTSYFVVYSKQRPSFQQYFSDFWIMFHTKVCEPVVPVNHNKQAIFMFWYLICQECPDNITNIVQNHQVSKKLTFNYILADHEDQDVVLFNKNMLPYYYGLLRLCCHQSRQFTRYLASHQNMQWAFKNITPFVNLYALTAQELFKLMRMFVTVHQEAYAQEMVEIANFKKVTLKMYLNVLDPNTHWSCLISAMAILVNTQDDLVYIILNNGLNLFFHSFYALHAMFHQATACHITNELIDMLKYISSLLSVFEENVYSNVLVDHRAELKELADIHKMLFLLNTYTPANVRLAMFEVLSKLVRVSPSDFIPIISSFLLSHHITFAEREHMFPNGPYFPKRGQKSYLARSSIRPQKLVFQMCFHVTILETAKPDGSHRDKEYESMVYDFYRPYYEFIQEINRVALKENLLCFELIDVSIRVAQESLFFHCKLLIDFWSSIYQSDEEIARNYIKHLTLSNCFKEYLASILLRERNFLDDDQVYEFMTIFVNKLSDQVVSPGVIKQTLSLIEAFCSTIDKLDFKITKQSITNLRTVKLICSTNTFNVNDSAQNIVLAKFAESLHKLKQKLADLCPCSSNTSSSTSIDSNVPPNKKAKTNTDTDLVDLNAMPSGPSTPPVCLVSPPSSPLSSAPGISTLSNNEFVKLDNLIEDILGLLKTKP